MTKFNFNVKIKGPNGQEIERAELLSNMLSEMIAAYRGSFGSRINHLKMEKLALEIKEGKEVELAEEDINNIERVIFSEEFQISQFVRMQMSNILHPEVIN